MDRHLHRKEWRLKNYKFPNQKKKKNVQMMIIKSLQEVIERGGIVRDEEAPLGVHLAVVFEEEEASTEGTSEAIPVDPFLDAIEMK